MGQTGFDIEKIGRVLMLYRVVKNTPEITPAELQQELGVTKSTLSRYRDLLRQLGADIVYNRKSGRYVLEYDAFLMTPALTLDERLAIILAVAQLGDMQTSFVSDQARNAASKLLSVQDAAVYAACAGLLNKSLNAPSPAGNVDHTVVHAVIAHKRLRLTYAKPGGSPEMFEMDPYQLFLRDGALYLDGYHWGRKAIRCLKVCRIRNAESTGVGFSNLRGYDFSRHRRNVFGVVATGNSPQTVRLWFSADAAPYIREERRDGQHITERGDGSLEYEISVDEPREVLWWAMRWGGDFEVLEPGWLREEAVEKVRKMAGVYGIKVTVHR